MRALILAAALALAAGPVAAQPSPTATEALQLTGRLETQTLESAQLGEPRAVTVYVPPGLTAGPPHPVIYMADGQSVGAVAQVLEPMILKGEVPPVLLVGLHSAPDGERRHREYLPNFAGEGEAPFTRNKAFLLREVMPMAEARYGASNRPGDRLLLGFSDGASWAAAVGLRHPALFGRVAALSLGWGETGPLTAGRAVRPRLYLAAGAQEGVFLDQTRTLASQARAVGYDVILDIRPGTHGFALWRQVFPAVFIWAFGPAKA